MSKGKTIAQNSTLPEAQDFEFLREEGLQYIERLSHAIWTDYNEHDPGITILEALCYAITELGYRSDFDINDLLAQKDGRTDYAQTFFAAKEILPTRPLTVNDYRKLLIDLPEVHNAWLYPKGNVGERSKNQKIPETEVPIYPNPEKDELSYSPYKREQEPVNIRGLYEVLLDLEESDEYGDLNTPNVFYTIKSWDNLTVEIIAPDGEAEEEDWLNEIYEEELPFEDLKVNAKNKIIDVVAKYIIEDKERVISYKLSWTGATGELEQSNEEITQKVKTLHQDILSDLYRKRQQTQMALRTVSEKLNANRNLCEDFIKIKTIDIEHIAFCADIELTPEADIEQVLAEIYRGIEKYFNPEVQFLSLREMVDREIPTEEIFEGPSLEHGFIDTDQLKQTQLRTEVRISDIINFVMDIKGIKAAKNVLLTPYDANGQPLSKGEKWKISLKKHQKPVLDKGRSKVLFHKQHLPFLADEEETDSILTYLQSKQTNLKYKGQQKDWPAPKGTHYPFDDYYSVQNDFPQTYGIGKAGLPDAASRERKGKAKQLKAYLSFYDQLLSGFFSQLYHAKNIFSLNPDLKQTYFNQYLSDREGMDQIFSSVEDEETGLSLSLKEVLNLSENASSTTFEKAKIRQYGKLIESRDTFFERRNRLLDHLMARFAESFNDHVYRLYISSHGEHIRKTKSRLIRDKINFLKDYPVISKNRGGAYNELGNSWNTDNVSGLQKRVARLTGIHKETRRNLFCYKEIPILKASEAAGYTFKIQVENTTNYLSPMNVQKDKESVIKLINKLYQSLSNPEYFIKEASSSSKIHVKVIDHFGKELAQSHTYFTNEKTADEFIKNITEDFSPSCEAEGLYLFENILLRPRFKEEESEDKTAEESYKLLPVCLGDDQERCSGGDPYSFRLWAILPFWPERFQRQTFRRFFERTIKKEAPAHTVVKVCWINYTSMKTFQTIYKDWLQALKQGKNNIEKPSREKRKKFRAANNKMISFLSRVHSEYPEARLFDCSEETENSMRLGFTKLGTF